jgi:hypothetical protein
MLIPIVLLTTGVVLPAVWSRRRYRREAAIGVLNALLAVLRRARL